MHPVRIGPYLIDRKIGAGGMGTVYVGKHEQSGQIAAIKTLPPSLARDNGFVLRFNREIEALKLLNHPNVVKFYDSGTDDEETYYYAMEYVEGETLSNRLRRDRRIPWKDAIQLAVQVCLGLKHAHDVGVVHRDLKPSNLLIASDGTVKITDFGVAQVFAADQLTITGAVIGTAEFMSPEQVEGRRADRRSDLYSLGAVLYLLPAMMQHLQRPTIIPQPVGSDDGAQSGLSLLWLRCGRLLCRWSGFNLGLSFALTALAVAGLTWFRTETKAIRYFPDDSRVVADYRFLEDNLAGIIPVDAIVRFSSTHQKLMTFEERTAAVMRLQQRLNGHPEISGSLSLASFLHGAEEPRTTARASRLRDQLTEEKLFAVLRDQKGPRQSVHSLLALSQQTVELPDVKRILQKNGDEIWRVTCQASILSDADYRQLTSDLTDLAGRELQNLPGGKPACLVTGLVPIFLRTQDALLESLIYSFAAAFGLITFVMAVLLRDVSAALLSMIPNVAPTAIVFGLLGWCGVRVDVGTMVTASVALGLAVDGTLHFLHVFRQELQPDVTREDAIARATAQCAPAIWQTSCAVGLGVLTLFPTELLLISRFGWVLAALVVAAMWGDLVLLPSLLNGLLGDLLVEKKKAADAAAAAAAAAARLVTGPATAVASGEPDDKPSVAIDSHPPAIVPVRPPHFLVRYSPNTSARE